MPNTNHELQAHVRITPPTRRRLKMAGAALGVHMGTLADAAIRECLDEWEGRLMDLVLKHHQSLPPPEDELPWTDNQGVESD